MLHKFGRNKELEVRMLEVPNVIALKCKMFTTVHNKKPYRTHGGRAPRLAVHHSREGVQVVPGFIIGHQTMMFIREPHQSTEEHTFAHGLTLVGVRGMFRQIPKDGT